MNRGPIAEAVDRLCRAGTRPFRPIEIVEPIVRAAHADEFAAVRLGP
jgi:hypothetical protein